MAMKAKSYPAIGERFGRLTVIGDFGTIEVTAKSLQKPMRVASCKCRCDCGDERVYRVNRLRSGVQSCGCYRREVAGSLAVRLHGDDTPEKRSRGRLWRIWRNMRSRCLDQKAKDYDRYGARGITICPEWLAFDPFHSWAIGHGYADNLTLERRENDVGYSPQNCCWATPTEQARNRRNNSEVAAFGESKCISAWASDPRCTVAKQTLRDRIARGVSPELAITARSLRG